MHQAGSIDMEPVHWSVCELQHGLIQLAKHVRGMARLDTKVGDTHLKNQESKQGGEVKLTEQGRKEAAVNLKVGLSYLQGSGCTN